MDTPLPDESPHPPLRSDDPPPVADDDLNEDLEHDGEVRETAAEPLLDGQAG